MGIQIDSMKKRYEAPTLLVHGKVAELTAAGGTGSCENNKGQKANPGGGGGSCA